MVAENVDADVINVKELIANDLEIKEKLIIEDIIEANGTETVTISNLAPAGVGTATISRWLKVRNAAGTNFYIPMWT